MIVLDDTAAAASASTSRRRGYSGAPAPAILDPSSSRRSGVRLLGVGIARRRLLSDRRGGTEDGTAAAGNAGPGTGIPPTLVFRRDAEQSDHQRRRRPRPDDPSLNNLGAPSFYLSAAFLTHDVVLASDDDGFVDVVRLPRYDGAGDSGLGETKTATGAFIGSTSTKRGTLLAGRVGEDRDGDKFCPPMSCHPAPHVALRGFRGGDAFACGMRSGELRIFATERVAAGKTDHRSNPSPFVGSASRVGGPRRRFRRGVGGGSLARALSTSGMASQAGTSSSWFDHHREEIRGWDAGKGKGGTGVGDGGAVIVPPDRSCDEVTFDLERAARRRGGAPLQDFSASRRRNEVSWDFCEGGGGGVGFGGNLLAAHVDCEADCFSLRLIDDRMFRGSVSQVGAHARIDPSDAMAVCVDRSALDWKRRRLAGHAFTVTEDVTGVCFASGCRLWTSHVVQRPLNVEQLGSWDIPCHNHIKQWDLRMLPPRRAFPAEEYRLVPSASHPSFPLDDVMGCTPTDEHVISFHRDQGHDGYGYLRFRRVSDGGGMGVYRGRRETSASALEALHERLLISGLTSSLDGCTVLATLRSLYDEPYHRPVLLDSSPVGGRRDALRVLGGPPVLSLEGGYLHQSDVLQAATPDHDVLVCHGAVKDPTAGTTDGDDDDDSPRDGQSVMLFDLSSTRVGCGLREGGGGGRHRPLSRRGAKRSRDASPKDGSSGDCRHDASTTTPMLGRLPVDTLVDEIGLRSQLMCLATNRFGTAIVCGTADGDLYAWRGA